MSPIAKPPLASPRDLGANATKDITGALNGIGVELHRTCSPPNCPRARSAVRRPMRSEAGFELGHVEQVKDPGAPSRQPEMSEGESTPQTRRPGGSTRLSGSVSAPRAR